MASHVVSAVTMRRLLSSFMTDDSSATRLRAAPLPDVARGGSAWGLVGVVAFSFTVPLTRVAVGGLSPLFIGSGRAVVAAALAASALALTQQPLPARRLWPRLLVVGAGIVIGFPLLTSFALRSVPASHGAAVIALLPAATAVMAVLRGHERPGVRFWLFAGAGACLTVLVASMQSGGFGALHAADLLLLGAVMAAAVGYAEGGLVAREIGAWQTVSWALVIVSPVMLALTAHAIVDQPPSATLIEWAAFAYLGVVSMFLGFFAWYRGLAIGPMAHVSQIQLVQPLLSILWAVALLGESVGVVTIVGGLAVIACSGLAVRARLDTR